MAATASPRGARPTGLTGRREGPPGRPGDGRDRRVPPGGRAATYEDGEDEVRAVGERDDSGVVRAGADGSCLVADLRPLREACPQPFVAGRAPAHRVEDAIRRGARQELAPMEAAEERRNGVRTRAVLRAFLERGEVLSHRRAHASFVEGDPDAGHPARGEGLLDGGRYAEESDQLVGSRVLAGDE